MGSEAKQPQTKSKASNNEKNHTKSKVKELPKGQLKLTDMF